MTPFWDYLWPLFAAAFVVGGVAGTLGLRQVIRFRLAIIGGLVVTAAAIALWQGPLGAAGRFTAQVERSARETLDNYEMPAVTARLHKRLLSRQLVLSGPGDDFQRSELARILSALPGVRSAGWSSRGGGLPLIAEGAGAALVGFLFGLLLAYLVELRRRHNAQWTW